MSFCPDDTAQQIASAANTVNAYSDNNNNVNNNNSIDDESVVARKANNHNKHNRRPARRVRAVIGERATASRARTTGRLGRARAIASRARTTTGRQEHAATGQGRGLAATGQG